MKLMISQNEPFVPIFNSWKLKSRELLPFDDDEARRQVEEIDAKVLSNRRPPTPSQEDCLMRLPTPKAM